VKCMEEEIIPFQVKMGMVILHALHPLLLLAWPDVIFAAARRTSGPPLALGTEHSNVLGVFKAAGRASASDAGGGAEARVRIVDATRVYFAPNVISNFTVG
jgi:hypothetical protein